LLEINHNNSGADEVPFPDDLRERAETAFSKSLTSLFAADPERVAGMVFQVAGARYDFSKTHLTSDFAAAAAAHCEREGYLNRVREMFDGAPVNVTESRAAFHTAWRASLPTGTTTASDPVAKLVSDANRRMRALVEEWRASDATTIIHIGIGGSALGPELALRALEPIADKRFDVRLLANVDGEAFARAVAGVAPQKVRVVVASKSWTTQETQHNAERVRDWLRAGGVENPGAVMAAVTQKVDAAAAWGVAQERVLPNPAWVGGRYSVWSPIGLPVALQIGWEQFEAFRSGALAVDRHFQEVPITENIVWLAALAGYCYTEFSHCRSRAVFSYDERLRLLPPHLSQLELESLGKSVDLNGAPVATTCGTLWGGTGTDAQHAVFQYLHQGTDVVPLDFIAVHKPAHDDQAAHRLLLANCFAQGAAFLKGRSAEETYAGLIGSGHDPAEAARLAPHMTFPGNRPSTTILLDELTPATLGGLIAFYEHRTFVQSLLWNINAFDQFGVELGKQLATQILAEGGSTLDSGTRALAKFLN
jgi:glucose-6-phosphate isomerase